MTYLETVNFIKHCANTINANGTFKNAKKSRSSLASKDAVYPLIVLLSIKTTTDYKKSVRTHSIVMLFVNQDDVDSTDEQQEQIFEDSFSLHDDFFKQVNAEIENLTGQYYGKFNLGQVLATPEQQIYNGTITGYGCQFTLTTKTTC